MVAPAVEGIDLFKIAGRSISGWIPSFKMGAVAPIRQPFCSQLEERLILWLEYHPEVVSYARGDIGQAFATTYRLPIPKFDASRLAEPQREQFHRNLRAVELVLAGATQTQVAKESGISRSTLSRLVKQSLERKDHLVAINGCKHSWPC